jgi:DNA repair exonuclease SbcCD ATPase subunit
MREESVPYNVFLEEIKDRREDASVILREIESALDACHGHYENPYARKLRSIEALHRELMTSLDRIISNNDIWITVDENIELRKDVEKLKSENSELNDAVRHLRQRVNELSQPRHIHQFGRP